MQVFDENLHNEDLTDHVTTDDLYQENDPSPEIESKTYPEMKCSKHPLRIKHSEEFLMSKIDELWLNVSLPFTKGELIQEQRKDDITNDIIEYIESGKLPNTSRRQRFVLLREHSSLVHNVVLYNLKDASLNDVNTLVRIWQ